MAYRYARATVLAPLTYSQLIWSSVLGYLVFGANLPDRWTLVGAVIIARQRHLRGASGAHTGRSPANVVRLRACFGPAAAPSASRSGRSTAPPIQISSSPT